MDESKNPMFESMLNNETNSPINLLRDFVFGLVEKLEMPKEFEEMINVDIEQFENRDYQRHL